MARYANVILRCTWGYYLDVFVRGVCFKLDSLMEVVLDNTVFVDAGRNTTDRAALRYYRRESRRALGFRMLRYIYFYNPAINYATKRALKRRIQRKVARRAQTTGQRRREYELSRQQTVGEIAIKQRLRRDLRKL